MPLRVGGGRVRGRWGAVAVSRNRLDITLLSQRIQHDLAPGTLKSILAMSTRVDHAEVVGARIALRFKKKTGSQTMRNLLTVCAALVVILGIASGNLWHELRSARQQIVDLQEQLAQAKIPVVQSAPVPAPPPTIEAAPVPPVAVQLPEAPPPPPAPRPLPVIVPAPERPLALPTLNRPLVGSTAEERRVEALAQSDRTATARVTQWSTVLNLTPEQLQVLNATTTAELRRETEDSLQIASRIGPTDPVSTARIKVDTVNRQYETLTRIVDKMAPQLTPEQSTRMRTMFASWLTSNMARARAEEQAALSGN